MILQGTRQLVLETFVKNKEKSVQDGMDISLCKISEVKIEFAGAKHAIWIVRKTEFLTEEQKKDYNNVIKKDVSLLVFKGDRQPLGFTYQMEKFHQQDIATFPGDRLFMQTDGFADQFGGNRNKKFKYKSIKHLLLNNYHLSLKSQKKTLKTAFEDWKGENEQVDDVCFVYIAL